MKKIFLLLFVFAGIFSSCTDDITDLNEDTVNPTAVPADFLFTNAQKNMVDQMVSTSVNLNVFRLFMQQWTETVYVDESNYDVTTRTIPDNHWQAIYRDVLRDLKEARPVLAAEVYTGTADEIATKEAERVNKGHIIDIMSAYAYSVLVDTFGDVPYTEALDPIAHPLPAYDDGETIYKDLIAKLTTASHGLDTSFGSFGSQDLIYGGDTAQWQKFANSLRLRMAINLDDIDHTYASTQAIAAVTDGVILSNSDNASLTYLSAKPNTNPVYVDVISTGRDDFVPTSTIIDQMNGLNDPRRAVYFTQFGGGYVGGTPGDGNTFANYSHIGTMLVNPSFEGTIFDAAETEFLLAEAVERGIAVGGTAAGHYTSAVTASLQYWGVSGGDIATYLANPSVTYATATGPWQQKIGEQAYLALYNRGLEAWISWRRLDYPVLVAPADASETEVPTRLTYPSREETLNATNVEAASIAIGGNTLTTRLFWDVN
ncbi:MAG: SusD/RagB family nutrient-binding outer membrane lipoprotein [Flavobacterium sp.]|uniref:SusD/RagB family nutrient-binding outer membrane lipoprotein n=1 Tax=Flavobacterium sp. TaxID=239 RepID=UPI0032664E5C